MQPVVWAVSLYASHSLGYLLHIAFDDTNPLLPLAHAVSVGVAVPTLAVYGALCATRTTNRRVALGTALMLTALVLEIVHYESDTLVDVRAAALQPYDTGKWVVAIAGAVKSFAPLVVTLPYRLLRWLIVGALWATVKWLTRGTIWLVGRILMGLFNMAWASACWIAHTAWWIVTAPFGVS